MMTTVSLKECGGRDNVVPTQSRKCQLTPINSVYLFIYLFTYLFIYLFTFILSHIVTLDLSKIIQVK
jgi:hypothetical protein